MMFSKLIDALGCLPAALYPSAFREPTQETDTHALEPRVLTWESLSYADDGHNRLERQLLL